MTGSEGEPSDAMPLWRKVAPFVIAAGLLVWLVHDLDRSHVETAIRQVSVPLYLAVLIALTVTGLVVDVVTSAAIYRRLLGPLPLGDLLAVRAAAFVPGLINFHLGQAWLTWVLVKRTGCAAHRAIAATLVTNAATLIALTSMTALAFGSREHAWLTTVGIGGVALLAAYLALLALAPHVVARWRVTAALAELGVAGSLWAVLVRLPQVAASFAIVWVPLRVFGVELPLSDALSVVPPVVVLAALPITPAGLGTRDAVAASLLATFADGSPEQQRATVIACTLTTGVVVSVIQLALALAFTSRARRLARVQSTL